MRNDIDITKPHPGRIYDYVLGGTQNFEADRRAAEGLLKVLPSFPLQARLNRWFLQMVASRWAEDGLTQVLDLGSGMPTQGHFNDYMSNARILFTDSDALTVEYGEELLKDKPGMRYAQTDLRNSETLFEAAKKFFGDDRKLGIGCIGVSYFSSDDDFRRLAKGLHTLCSAGSVMAVSFVVPVSDPKVVADLIESYRHIVNIKLYTRTLEEIAEMLQPWRVVEHAPVEQWLAVPDVFGDEEHPVPIRMMGLFAAH